MKKPVFKLYKKPVEQQIAILYSLIGIETELPREWLIEYFGLNVAMFKNLSIEERKNLLKHTIEEIYNKQRNAIDKSINDMQKLLPTFEEDLISIFADVFNIKYDGNEDYVIMAGISPMCPRFLEAKSFDICIFNTFKQINQTIVHEMIHFFWFEKLKELNFNLNATDKEYPNPIWLISEIVVDCIIKDTELKKYLANSHPAYNIFYSTEIGGENIINKFDKEFKNAKNIVEFIKFTENFLQKYKNELDLLALKC